MDPAARLQDLHLSNTSDAGPSRSAPPVIESNKRDEELYYRAYRSEEEDMGHIMSLSAQELSEPYVMGYRK